MKFKSIALVLIVLFSIGMSVEMWAAPAGSPSGSPQRGIAYGNKLKPGWTCLYQWFKGAWGREKYRRQIVAIRINGQMAKVFFSNGSSRNFYQYAIINHDNTTPGSLPHWRRARNNRKDTILLKNGQMVHAIIRGFNNGKYHFKRRPPIHRSRIMIVYPNPTIPYRNRL